MDGGAEVVAEAGKGELHGAAGAADGGLGFVDVYGETSLGKHDSGGEAVGTGADDSCFQQATWSGDAHFVRVVLSAG